MVQAGSGDESNSDSDQNSGGSDNDTTKSDNDTTKSDNDTTKDSDGESKGSDKGSKRSSKSSGSDSNSNNSSDDSDSSRASSSKSKSVGGAPGSSPGGGRSSDDSSPRPTARNKKRKEGERVWEENPDIYGIRRSGRSRKEPERLQSRKVNQDTDDSDEPGRKRGGRRKSAQSKDTWNSDSSEYDSETDKESPTPRKAPPRPKPSSRATASKKRSYLSSSRSSKNQRRSKLSSSDSESYDSDESKIKPARRNARPVKSYKEDSDKTDSDDLIEVDPSVEVEEPVPDNSETIERVIASRRGKKGVVGSVTTAYYVEEHGDGNADCDINDKENTEEQFLIKWKGWSHIHNTWESEASLKAQEVKGLKKLENFKKKEEELAYWRQHTTPEDVEYFECQLELQGELMKSYNHVERIIVDRKTPDIGHEYFVKWESLPYAEATWEESSLIKRKWPKKIKEFREREDSKRTPSKLTRALKYRPKFRQVHEQPEYMGGDQILVLRDYQINGLNWMIHAWCKENSVILADEMGLGKTIQTICFLYYLFNAYDVHGPFLVVVPLSTMAAWQREFQLWAPEMNVVTYLGDVGSRNIIRDYEWCFASSQRLKFNAILTTYEILLKDKSFLGTLSWAVLMVDEAHRLKNDDSLLYKALFEFKTNHRLLITGTPLQNSLKELWALLHFIMPYKFDSWEEFEKEHDNAANKGYQKLHKQLEPYILRRVKKDVEKSLPAKVEQILRVEMTGLQKQYYKWILTKNFSALKKGNKGSTTTFLNIMIELKKCCNHAFLTKRDESEPSRNSEDYLKTLVRGSGKLVLLDKLLVRLRETGHRVLIFSQMVRMLDILAEYLQLRHFTFQRLDGSIKGEIRRQALDHFNAEGSSDFCFLLSTRAGGLGINLATADTVIIFDSDWNPQNDLQAQARAHRIGQKNQVNIYRLVTAESVEEDIVERAKRKMVLDHLVIQRMDTTGRTVLDKKAPNQATPFNKDELTAILKFGAERLFNNEDENGDEDPICDIDEILRRAELRDEAPATVGDELLSAFKVASFATNTDEELKEDLKMEGEQEEESKDWDDIIPENLRKKVEEEEKAKEMEDLYLPPRSRKTLQQVNQSEDEGEGRRGRKRKGGEEKEEGSGGDSSYDEDDSDDERPKKRGRPKANSKESVKGFTDVEIRRFVKSFKKFPAPLKRLEAVACDAELQEKPLADLKKLGETLQERCRRSMDESVSASASQKENENQNEDSNLSATKKPRTRAPTCKLGGVTVNAKSVITCSQELEPLDSLLPATAEDRSKWVLDVRVKSANFDVEWGIDEDSKLLLGIYQYGLGSWEAIKMDPGLGISDKILSNEDKKPQSKHLLLRAEYLLRVLKKKLAAATKPAKTRKKRGKEAKALTKEIVEDDNSSGDEGGEKKEGDDKKKKTKEVKKKKKQEGPMHFTANSEPRALDVLGDLDPSVFNECKEKMRPVKKALKALDSPDLTLSPEDQLAHTLQCLLQIGEQINKTLATYKDPVKSNEWRSNLWYFVSKFTEYDAKKLYKLYKHAIKRGGGNTTEASSKSTTPSTTPVKKEKKDHKHHHKDKQKEKSKEKEEKAEKKKKRKHEDPEEDGEVGVKEKHRREKNSKDEGGKKQKLEEIAEENKRERKDSDRRGGDRSEEERERGSSKYNRNSANSQNSDPRGNSSRGNSNWQSSNSRYSSGYDGYNSRSSSGGAGSSGYGRERERGERAHSRYDDKRSRYHPPGPGYPPYGAPPPPGALYYPPGAPIDPHLAGGWERYPPNAIPPPGGYSEWRPKERDYRRDYDRRPATSNS